MPTPIAVNDVWAYSVRSSYLAQPVINTVHLAITEITGSIPTDVQLGFALVNSGSSPLITLIQSCAVEQLVQREASMQWMWRIGDVYPGVVHQTFRGALNIPGTVDGNPYAGQPSMTVSTYGEYSDSRAFRGGVRLSGISELSMSEGMLTTAFLSSVNAELATCFLNDWPVSVEDTEVSMMPVIFSRTEWKAGHTGVYAGIDQVVMRQVPGTIRRRKEYSSQGGYPV